MRDDYDNRAWQCALCPRRFQERSQLVRHRRDIHGPTVRCNECEFEVPASRMYLLRRHMERQHDLGGEDEAQPRVRSEYTPHGQERSAKPKPQDKSGRKTSRTSSKASDKTSREKSKGKPMATTSKPAEKLQPKSVVSNPIPRDYVIPKNRSNEPKEPTKRKAPTQPSATSPKRNKGSATPAPTRDTTPPRPKTPSRTQEKTPPRHKTPSQKTPTPPRQKTPPSLPQHKTPSHPRQKTPSPTRDRTPSPPEHQAPSPRHRTPSPTSNPPQAKTPSPGPPTKTSTPPRDEEPSIGSARRRTRVRQLSSSSSSSSASTSSSSSSTSSEEEQVVPPTTADRELPADTLDDGPSITILAAPQKSPSEIRSPNLKSSSPLSASSPGSVRQRVPVETIPQMPTYDPKPWGCTEQRGGRYEYLHTDPRIFFLGAPSLYTSAFPAHHMRALRREAVEVSSTPSTRTVQHMPPGVSSIMRTERAVLPDGTVYELRATWVQDPYSRVMREMGTQTD